MKYKYRFKRKWERDSEPTRLLGSKLGMSNKGLLMKRGKLISKPPLKTHPGGLTDFLQK